MAEARLSVELEANINNWRANLESAQSELTATGQAAQAASNTISQNIQRVNALNLQGFNRALQSGEVSIRNLNTASNSISRGLAAAAASSASSGQAIANGANQAGFALTNVGRIAQDLPFGFIGIQNNLNPMLESFQRLQATTGSAGAALAAMGRELLGPAGLGVALSVVSAGILLYQKYQQSANKEAEKAEKASQRAAKAANDYAETLSGVARAQIDGTKNAQSELVTLRLLYSQYTDTNQPLKYRKEAYDQLQKLYPDYFGNLKFENDKSKELKTSYDELTGSILASARARAAADLIAKNEGIKFTNEQKRIDLEKEQIKNKRELDRLLAENPGLGSGDTKASAYLKDYTSKLLALGKATGGQQITLKGLQDAQEKYNKNLSDRRDLVSENNKLTLESARLDRYAKEQQSKGGLVSGNVGGEAEKQGKKVKTLADVMKELNTDLIQADNAFQDTFDEKSAKKIDAYQKAIDELIKLGYNPATKAVEDLKKAQQSLFQLEPVKALKDPFSKKKDGSSDFVDVSKERKIGVVGNNRGKDTILGLKTITDEQEAIIKAQEQFNKDFNKLIQDGLMTPLSSVGTAIGEALASGGDVLGAVGGALLQGFADFLSEFGDLLIKYGAAAVLKGKLDIAAFIPGAGIVAGAAAIAAGIALKAAAGAINSLGKKSGQTSAPNKPTAFANGGVIYGPTLGIMGEYAGAKNNPEVVAPLNKLKSLMGDRSSGVYIPDIKLKGEDIFISFNRTKTRLGRI